MSAWTKRVAVTTHRGIAQNMSLGVRYFRYAAIEDERIEVETVRLGTADAVLEEVALHGRCVIALPDEQRVAVYSVDGGRGEWAITWYERLTLLDPVSPGNG